MSDQETPQTPVQKDEKPEEIKRGHTPLVVPSPKREPNQIKRKREDSVMTPPKKDVEIGGGSCTEQKVPEEVPAVPVRVSHYQKASVEEVVDEHFVKKNRRRKW